MMRLGDWLRSIVFVGMTLVGLLHGTAHAQTSVTVPLRFQGSTIADGAATLTTDGIRTHVVLDMRGLAPHQTANVVLTAGSCAMPGGSTVRLSALAADVQGRATARGDVLFRGTEPVSLRDIADGAHAISVVGADGALACGEVPRLVAATAPRSLLDANRGIERNDLLLLAAIIALAAGLAFQPRLRGAR